MAYIRALVLFSAGIRFMSCVTASFESEALPVVHLLGKNRQSPEFQQMRDRLSTPKVDVIQKSVNYSFKNDGLQFMFENEVLIEIWYFNRGNFYHERWPYRSRGELPLGLSLSDSKEHILDMIGPPTRFFFDGYYEVWRYECGVQVFVLHQDW